MIPIPGPSSLIAALSVSGMPLDKFIFYGSKTSKNLQIGNAVPPLLGEIIGKQIIKSLNSK